MIHRIARAVADNHRVSVSSILDHCSEPAVVHARHAAWIFSYKAGFSYDDIGGVFGYSPRTVRSVLGENKNTAPKYKEAYKVARQALGDCPTEDNYREAMLALELWRPTPRFSRHFQCQPMKADPEYAKKNRARIKAVLSDELMSARQIHEALGGVGESTGATRKTIESLCRLGEAQMVREGNRVFYRRAS